MNESKISNAGAKRLKLLLKAINYFGIENREAIYQILETIDFEKYDESEAWNTLEKGLKKI